MKTFGTKTSRLRKEIIENITALVNAAPDKKVNFRFYNNPNNDEETILADVSVGSRDSDGCYPDVLHVRIDLGTKPIVCLDGSYETTDVPIDDCDLSIDDLSAINDNIVMILEKTNKTA